MSDEKCCPRCASHYTAIHGMVYPASSHEGHPCDNDWHRGASYTPSILILTKEDRELMKLARILV